MLRSIRLLAFLLWLAGLLLPTAALAHTIAAAEYYIDTDPGQGSAAPIIASDGALDSALEALNFQINVDTLGEGRHVLHLRARNEAGTWGIPRAFTFYVTANKTIEAMEYFLDVDPGEGAGSPVLPLDGVCDEASEQIELPNIASSDLGQGLHTFFLRARSSEGVWGAARPYVFEVSKPWLIKRAEFFIDNDPGQGNALALEPVDGAFNSFTEELLAAYGVSGLAVGAHLLHARSLDGNNSWSTPQSTPFEIIDQTAQPLFSSAPGTYTTAQTIALSCATADAVIHYTSDGSEPTAASPVYTAALTVGEEMSLTIKAKAFKSGWLASETASATFVVTGTVADPQIAPASGAYTTPQNILLSCATPGAVIRYTTDGSEPGENSSVYSAPIGIPLDTVMIVTAKAFKTDWATSGTVTANFTVTGTVATPNFSPQGNSYDAIQAVTISCPTDGAAIRYTTDGSEPSQESPLYSGPVIIPLDSSITLAARAFKTDWLPSSIQTESYTVADTKPPSSTITAPAAGALLWLDSVVVTGTASDNTGGSGVVQVEISTDGGATWHKATGTVSWSYSWTLPESGEFTLVSRATDGSGNVEIATAGLTLTVDQSLPQPVIDLQSSPAASTWSADNTITVSWSPGESDSAATAGYSFVWDSNPDTSPDTSPETIDTTTTSAALADGANHYFHIAAVNAAGKTGATSHLGPFFIDTTPPLITGLESAVIPVKEITWNWDAEDASAVSFRHQIDQNPSWEDPSGAFAATKTAAKNEGAGTWYLHVQAKDETGNQSAVTTVAVTLVQPYDQPASSVALYPAPGQVFKDVYQMGESVQLVANYKNSAGLDFNLADLQGLLEANWSSNNTAVATVSGGTVQFKGNGVVKIIISTQGLMSQREFTVGKQVAQKSHGNLIVLAGGKSNDPKDKLKDAVQYLANRMYQIFRTRGFADDDIFYLNHQYGQDLDGDGTGDNIVDQTVKSVQGLQEAIVWAKTQPNSGPLYLYLVDHGANNGTFMIESQQILSAHQLDDFLDDFEESGRPVVVILEACYSGSFVAQLQDTDRVILTSSADNQYSYLSDSGAIAFSQFLSNYLLVGYDWIESFDLAAADLTAMGMPYNKMNPQKAIGETVELGKVFGDFSMAAYLPGFLSFSPGMAVSGSAPVGLSTELDILDIDGVQVWAMVRPPSYQPASVTEEYDTPPLGLTRIDLTNTANTKKFTAAHAFTANGQHQLIFYAQDANNNVVSTPPQTFTVSGVQESALTWNIQPGWNLLGARAALDVTALFTDAGYTSVWRWKDNTWQLRLPGEADGGIAYAASKGFGLLATIDPGDGFWVNSQTPAVVTLQESPATGPLTLAAGWNLCALKSATPTQPAPLLGDQKAKVVSMWKWQNNNWAVSLPGEADNGQAYAATKNFVLLDTINPDEGFWVNTNEAITIP